MEENLHRVEKNLHLAAIATAVVGLGLAAIFTVISVAARQEAFPALAASASASELLADTASYQHWLRAAHVQAPATEFLGFMPDTF